MVTREAIVTAARGWLGTPYHHQASVKGVGSDCLGLIRGIWRELYGPEPEAMPPYTPDWGQRYRVGNTARRRLPAPRQA